MEIAIRYLSGNGKLPGVLEVFRRDACSDTERYRVGFLEKDGRASLTVKRPGTTPGAWTVEEELLAKKCVDGNAYIAWLEDTVEWITVDGEPFWDNPGIFRRVLDEIEGASGGRLVSFESPDREPCRR